MKTTKTWMALLSAAVLLLALSCAFAVPSGAILPEAASRYQDEAPIDWDEDATDADWGASLKPYRVIASAALSDILPVNDIAMLDTSLETVGRAPVEANFTDAGYRDDTIIVEVQEVRQDDSIYHVAYVKIATPSQLRTAVAGGVNSSRTIPTSTLARSVNAVVAVNGDFFSKSTGGYIVRQGETLRKKVSDNYDLLLIDENADFHLVLAGKTNQKNAIESLLESHEILNAFFFGPALVMDGVVQNVPKEYGWNPFGQEPRAAIGQIGPLTYAVVTVDGRIADSEGVTLDTLAAFMGQIGCQEAYNLDGGNSSALVYHNRLLSIKDVEERSVNDIIYFASATEQGAAQ
ncbi:MAG: phosphodiester glycosidase family protein [Clostridiales bacterium]|nr:phosphodiester glycosidase family protein [Clostridiales bacterium]